MNGAPARVRQLVVEEGALGVMEAVAVGVMEAVVAAVEEVFAASLSPTVGAEVVYSCYLHDLRLASMDPAPGTRSFLGGLGDRSESSFREPSRL